jgi:predicted Zn-dependent peptidase
MAYDNAVNRRAGYANLDVLKSFTVEEANRFHQTYYTPSNAALALVGDFDPANARARIEHHFGSIPKRPAPPPPDIREPGRSAEARRTTTSPLAQAPLLMLAWRTPSPADPDWFPLRALINLLAGNEASRLQTALVKGSGVATAIQVIQEDNSGVNLLMLNIVAAPGKDLAQVESRTYQEIERIAKEGVSEAEMDRMFIGHGRSRAVSLLTTTARGAAMSRLLGSHGYPEGLNEWGKELRKVNSESLRRVIAKYFTPANRSVLFVYPAGREPR